MPLTTRRWRLSLVAIVATTLAAVLVLSDDDRSTMSDWWSLRIDARPRIQRSIAAALQREGRMALREALLAVTKETSIPAGSNDAATTPISVAAADTIAERYLPTLRRLVEQEWSALGIGARDADIAPRPRTQVLLVGDVPPSVPQRFTSLTRDASVGRFVRVPRTIDEPCSIIITLRRAEPALLQQQLAGGVGILGPCGFVAAFGLPEGGLRSALDSIEWSAAAFASWHAPSTAVDARRQAWADLSAPAVRCLTRADAACSDARRILATTPDDEAERYAIPPSDPAVWDVTRLSWFPFAGASLGTREGFLLSDVVRASDREAYGTAWRTSASLEQLIERATGTHHDAWVSRWLADQYRAPVVGPAPNAREVGWTLLIAAVTSLMIVAMPRVRRRVVARS